MYGNRRSRIDRIWDYAHAVEREAETKPIRGKTTKPVGLRRNQHMQILKDGENVVCRLYETDVVTYKPNGEIAIKLNGWTSQTTTAFINDLVGNNFGIFDNQMWTHALYNNTRGYFPLHTHGENVFNRTEGGNLVFTNPAPNTIHKVNRAGANKVRRRYKDFKDYVVRVCKLRAESDGAFTVSLDERKAVLGDDYKNAVYISRFVRLPQNIFAQFQLLIDKHGDEDKTEDYYKAFLLLASRAGRYLSENTLLKQLDEVILFVHRDEVFDEINCFGELKRDAYSRFF